MSAYSRTDSCGGSGKGGGGGGGKGGGAGGSSVQDQIAALMSQLEELKAAAAAEAAAASSSGPSPVAAEPAPVAVPPGSTGAGSVGGGGRFRRQARSEGSSSATSVATTSVYRGAGALPVTIPKVAANYHPMPINPNAVKKAVGGAVPSGSPPSVSGTSDSFVKIDLEDDAEITSGSEAKERPRKASKPSEPHPANESPLRGMSYTGAPFAKIAARKPDAKLVPPTLQVLDEATDVPEWKNIPRLRRLADADSTTMPVVTCSEYGCGAKESWKKMESQRIYIHVEEMKGDKDDDFVYYRVCWKCVGIRENLMENGVPHEGQCRAFIREHKPDFARKQKETDNYKIAKKHAQVLFPMMMVCSLRNKAVRELEHIDSFSALMAPLLEFILIKDVQLQGMADDMSNAVKLMTELRACVDPVKIKDLLERIELMTADGPLKAFVDTEDADRKWLATTFADEWSGVMGGWFRSYYICCHNCEWRKEGTVDVPVLTDKSCNVAIPSKEWDRKKEDPMAPRQAYYCHTFHKHNASWGQIVEIMTLSGKLMYAWAEVPSAHLQDIRALKIEKDCPGMSADQIFESLPIILPQTHSEISVHLTANAGLSRPKYFSMRPEFFNNLSVFKWHQIFNMTGAPIKEQLQTGKQAKKALEWQIDGRKKELTKSIKSREGTSTSSKQP